MTKNEFAQAVKMAESNVDLSDADWSNLDGFGLRTFGPVATTIKAVARLIRWQARLFNGQWDAQALDDVRQCSRRRFEIIG